MPLYNPVCTLKTNTFLSSSAKTQRQSLDFLFEGMAAPNQANVLTLIPIEGVQIPNLASILTTVNNSVILGKLNVVIKEVGSPAVTAWVDAQVLISNETENPFIIINKFDLISGISGVEFSVDKSLTILNGVEFRVTSATSRFLRAKASFEYNLVMD